MRRGVSWLVGVLVLAGVVFAGYRAIVPGGYQLQIVFPSAANLQAGSPVQVHGSQVGSVDRLETRDGQAVVTVSLSGEGEPMHAGTTARVEWKSLVGERLIELQLGPQGNPELPSGALVQARPAQVELDEVLAALDPPTRDRLSSLTQQVRQTLGGREQDLGATLRTAGPAISSLGHVLNAVGKDAPAIRNLVTELHQMVRPLAERDRTMQQTVENLTQATGPVAGQADQLRAGLRQLPSTLDTAQQALGRVPAAADAASPLLAELRPSTQRLPSVARNLSPLLRDLRPTVAQLRPTLESAQGLLKSAPGLLDAAHGVVPGVNKALTQAAPAVSFLRPYAPELMGALANWGSGFSQYDSQGHYTHAQIEAGASALNSNPGVPLPGLTATPRPAPGSLVGQPWTDANGSGIR